MTLKLTGCYNSANIFIERNNEGIICVGGILGNSANNGNGKILVENSYSVRNIYFKYNTNNDNTYVYIGGLVGLSNNLTVLNNCYNVGKINIENQSEDLSSLYIGNLWGKFAEPQHLDENNYYNIQNCYYINDKPVGDETVHEGYKIDLKEKKTPDELKKLYETLGTAFKKDEKNINNGYPILNWQ